ncbi:FERM and PDZ domain-containing protein 2 [Xyrichtys novacula]|uniref:FERM and PDZ domain-containing protein 2 n=1 Tax=Xyrichtys novacula TaxID=13765 RepID=A0AAV1G297_XYRNO|nr:FERM and PDZ domain-containing protein 2 [Xyrichtys novacula]
MLRYNNGSLHAASVCEGIKKPTPARPAGTSCAQKHRHGSPSQHRLPQRDEPTTVSYPLFEESPQCYDHCEGAALEQQQQQQQAATVHSFGRGRSSFPGFCVAHLPPEIHRTFGRQTD